MLIEVSLWADAAEAIVQRQIPRGKRPSASTPMSSASLGGAVRVAATRARSQVRRFAVANHLDSFGTFTTAEFVPSADILRETAIWIRKVRAVEANGDRFPYVFVIEGGNGGIRPHVHALMPMPIGEACVSTWPLGHSKQVKLGTNDEIREKAHYMSKEFGDRLIVGRQRYRVAQGFQPERQRRVFASLDEARAWTAEVMGEDRSKEWSSGGDDDWRGPSTRVWTWG